MASGRPDLRLAEKARAAAAFFLAGAAAGTGLYFGNLAYVRAHDASVRAHDALKVTEVTVYAASLRNCQGLVQVTGTIFTNGKSGPITYQWIKGGVALPAATVTNKIGQDMVPVTLNWSFRGYGTAQEVATLNVLSPDAASANIEFTYSCAL